MSIGFGGIVAFLFRGVNLLVALILLYVTAVELGDAGRGAFVLGTTAIGIVTAFSTGLTAAAAYQVSNQKRLPGQVLLNGSVVASAVGVLAVVAGILGAQILSGDASSASLAVGAAAAAVVATSILSGVFLGNDQLVKYNIALVLPPVLALASILITLFVLGQKTAEASLAAFAVGQWAAFPLLMVIAAPHLRSLGAFKPGIFRNIAKFAAIAGLSTVISYLNYRADTFVVEHFEGKSGVGVYSSAVQFAEAIWQFSGSLALAAYARVGSVEREEAAELTGRIMRHTLVILAVVCGALFLMAPIIIGFLPESFGGASTALRILLPGTLVYGLASSLSGFYTYQRGMPWVAAAIAGTGLMIDIALDFTLIPVMGINGAALASTIAYSTAIVGALAFFLWDTKKTPAEVFRFKRADLDDYRSLVTRLRAALSRRHEEGAPVS